jgi:cellulase/cellobiase CelA1
VIVFGAGLVPAAADAARVDPLGFQLSSSTYHVPESVGAAVITVRRLNTTSTAWIRYGEVVSRLTGGKHFVVNTAENGQGPLRPRNRVRYGNEVLCNLPGRGLGPKPTFHTGFPKVDAFAWLANPGRSGGQCRPGAPQAGYFWPKLALDLVRNADYGVR